MKPEEFKVGMKVVLPEESNINTHKSHFGKVQEVLSIGNGNIKTTLCPAFSDESPYAKGLTFYEVDISNYSIFN